MKQNQWMACRVNYRLITPARHSCDTSLTYPWAVAILALGLFMQLIPAHATSYPPADHHGTDLTLQDGDLIWGLHKNIRTFTIAAESTCTVPPDYDPWAGSVRIEAEYISLLGKLNAAAAGAYGGGGGSAYNGTAPGAGSGPFGGVPLASWEDQLSSQTAGGYTAPMINGDTTTSTHVHKGSGGAGGWAAGSYENCTFNGCYPWGYIGDSGGRGGGCIQLKGTKQIFVGPAATLVTNGSPADNYNWAIPDAGSGGGGGILIDGSVATSVTLTQGAQVISLGGDGTTANGGTFKLLTSANAAVQNDAKITTGRIFSSSTQPESGASDLSVAGGNVVTAPCRGPNAQCFIASVFIANLGSTIPGQKAMLTITMRDDTQRTGLVTLKKMKLKNLESGCATIPIKLKIRGPVWPTANLVLTVTGSDADLSNNLATISGFQ